MTDYTRFATWELYCRRTCVGGSDKGQCPCKRIDDCAMAKHPDFKEQVVASWKREAARRTHRT